MNVVLHIERVVLDGFSFTAPERAQLRSALEAELGDRLAGCDRSLLLASGGAVSRFSATGVPLSSMSPLQVAAGLADSVATALGPTPAGARR